MLSFNPQLWLVKNAKIGGGGGGFKTTGFQ